MRLYQRPSVYFFACALALCLGALGFGRATTETLAYGPPAETAAFCQFIADDTVAGRPPCASLARIRTATAAGKSGDN